MVVFKTTDSFQDSQKKYTSIIQKIEYCSQVSTLASYSGPISGQRLATLTGLLCFLSIPTDKSHDNTLNLTITTSVYSFTIQDSLVILSLSSVSSEQLTVLLNQSYINIQL